jgi:hypothetical protein
VLGEVPAGSEATHEPRCTEDCDVGLLTGGCDCWYECTAEDQLTLDDYNFTMLDLFPRAIARLESLLEVRRTTLTLDVPGGVCGCASDWVDVRSGFEEGKTTSPLQDYDQYTDADLVLLATGRSNRFRAGSTLATACPCQSDWFGRPIFGHINVASNRIDHTNPDVYEEQLSVAMHEIIHVLGFTAQRLDDFVHPDLEEMVASGDVRYPTDRVPLRDGLITRSSTETHANGLTSEVLRVLTPSAVAAARAHFDCPTLAGPELENFGADGTVGSHWEKRQWGNELMTGSSSYSPVLGNVTLSLLEDSGWYRVKKDGAGKLLYGLGEGCAFAGPDCSTWTGAYSCSPNDQRHWGCTWDRRARGVCTISAYGETLPPVYRYWPEANVGGGQFEDFCALYAYSEALEGNCERASQQADWLFVRGEVFGPGSVCVESTLLHESKTNFLGAAGCHPIRCLDDLLFIRIHHKFHACPVPGAELLVPDYAGFIKCPTAQETAALCADSTKTIEKWPSIADVAPRQGRPGDGLSLTIRGADLGGAIEVWIGRSIPCRAGLVVNPQGTEIICKFSAKEVEAEPGSAEEGGEILEGAKEIFVSSDARDYLDVHVVLADGRTGFVRAAFDVRSASLSLSLSPALLLGSFLLLVQL